MSDLPSTIVAIATALAERQMSSREITQAYLDRIHDHEPAINSFITVADELALTQADAADDRRARGESLGALDGVPFAHKDIFCTEGIKTTCGSRMLDNFVAPYSATVTERLASHGMVMLGKTNMDEFAMGSSNETSFYGVARNPWDTDHVPGGSSGGSAAAVAAQLSPCATGTDTGGSIRQPASFCGVSGIKPTYGLVSRYGMIAFASSLDQGGPMAWCAEDLATMLGAMVGFDPLDSTSVQRTEENYTTALRDSIAGMTLGLPRQFFDESLDDAVATCIEDARVVLENAGARIIEVELPNLDLAIPAYYVISSAECSSNLARYDGVRYGYRCEEPKDLDDLYCRSRSEAFGQETKRRILVGTYALSAGYYDAYYNKAQKIRRLIQQDFNRAFEQVDAIIGPTSPTTAFKIGQKINDPVSMYLSDIYTTAVNLAGLPGASIPAGFADGLPVGMQLIGPHFAEARLLRIAYHYQQDSDWHCRRPKLEEGGRS